MKVDPPPRGRRAISGILAAVLFFAMLFTAGMSLVLYTFTSYNNYNKAQVQAVQDQQAKSAESLSLRSCDTANYPLPPLAPYTPPGCGVIGTHIGVWIQNVGPTAVTLVTLWIEETTTAPPTMVVNPTTSPPPPTTPSLSYTVNPGSTVVIDTGVSPTGSDSYAISFITSTGNQFAATYPPPPTSVSPGLFTTLYPGSTVEPGTSVYDAASITGIPTTTGAEVNYYSYGVPATGVQDGICSGTGTLIATVPVTGTTVPPSYPTAPEVQYPVAGIYSWNAELVDTGNPSGIWSPCEPLDVLNAPLPAPTASASGLGFITMDFTTYKYFTTSGNCNPTNTGCQLTNPGGGAFNPSSAPTAYTLPSPSSTYYVFSVNLADTNPNANIVIDPATSSFYFFQVVSGSGSSFKSYVWGLGSVGGTGVTVAHTPIVLTAPTCSGSPVTCTYNYVPFYFTVVPTTSGSGGGGSYNAPGPGVYAGSFYLHGSMGAGCTSLGCGAGIGQNEPLVVSQFT